MKQDWSVNTDLGVDLGQVGARLLAIVGPSGSGKTAIASMLQQCRGVRVIPIYTTRPARSDDVHGHYRYLSSNAFFEMESRGEFFLCRQAPYPAYGWGRRDLMNIVEDDVLGVMLFRHGGVRFLLDILPLMRVVLIEPTLKLSSLHSSGRIKQEDELDPGAVMVENRKLQILATEKGWPSKIIENRYSGRDELQEHATSILHWARSNTQSTS